MIRLTLYTRPECHLCDAAKFVLRKVQCTHPFELVEVDISAPGNTALLEKYEHHIPVICCGDEEWFRHRVVESEVRKRLELRAKANWKKTQKARPILFRRLIYARRPTAAYLFKRQEGLPIAYWRFIKPAYQISFTLMILLMATCLSIFAYVLITGNLKHLGWAMLLGAFLFMLELLSPIVFFLLHRSFLKKLKGTDNRLCLVCRYSLVGLPETHECPECGQSYNLEQTRLAWSNWQFTGDMSQSEWD